MSIKTYDKDSEKLSETIDQNSVLKNLSQQDFLDLGVHNIAYIRPVIANNTQQYAIHAADGTSLSTLESYEKALGTIIQNDLQAVTLH